MEKISKNKIIFDVGANNGDSSIPFAEKSVDTVVYAFEPTPELCDIIRRKTKNLPNYILVPKAVSDFSGTATFNVTYETGGADGGCSSLLEFNDNLEKNWSGRTDLKVAKRITVDVITLKEFAEQNNICRIDFLHCDAQGNDIRVLRSLGEKISIVRSGMLEVNKNTGVGLYKESDNTLRNAKIFLRKNGFTITNIRGNNPNSLFANEYNVSFAKGPAAYTAIMYNYSIGLLLHITHVTYNNSCLGPLKNRIIKSVRNIFHEKI